MYFVKVKENLKKEIMVALNKGKAVSKKKLLARLRLETGLTNKLIEGMLSDLAEIGYLTIDEDVLKVKKRK